MSTGTDIVDLLKQRELELERELVRIRTALRALGSASASTTSSSTGSAKTSAKASTKASTTRGGADKPKGKPGRPSSTVGGKTVLERIEAALADARRPLRVQELAKLVGGSYSTLSTMLRRGKDNKRLVNVGFGTWTVPGVGGAVASSQTARKAKKKTATTTTTTKKKKKKKKKKRAGQKPGPKATGKKRGRPAKSPEAPVSTTSAV